MHPIDPKVRQAWIDRYVDAFRDIDALLQDLPPACKDQDPELTPLEDLERSIATVLRDSEHLWKEEY